MLLFDVSSSVDEALLLLALDGVYVVFEECSTGVDVDRLLQDIKLCDFRFALKKHIWFRCRWV